jgi:SAM-dependent methyltransferase
MADQAKEWSRLAADYERQFIDPYRRDVRNPIKRALARVPDAGEKVAADLGCGTGPLLPFLAQRFSRVYALDFAEGMLDRARARCAGLANVSYLASSLTDLEPLHGRLDVAVAVNSLILPDPRDLTESLSQIRRTLRPGGRLFGIVPAIDSVHYYTMLLLERALDAGKPLAVAYKNAAHLAEHKDYDFAFGRVAFDGLEQHFWQPFEVRHRLTRAGFHNVRLKKVLLSWDQFAVYEDLKQHPPPWDWFFTADRDPAG